MGYLDDMGVRNALGQTVARPPVTPAALAVRAENYARQLVSPAPQKTSTDIVTGASPIGGVAGLLGLPAGLVGLFSALGIGYGIYQGLGGGEGGGIGGINLLGDPATTIPGSDVVLQGPGLAEPYPAMIAKEWNANGSQFYQLTDGRIAVYSPKSKKWKVYRPPKLAVIGKNMPSHRMLTRLRRNLKRHSDDAVTLLKVTNPGKLRQYQRVATGYKIRRKYR